MMALDVEDGSGETAKKTVQASNLEINCGSGSIESPYAICDSASGRNIEIGMSEKLFLNTQRPRNFLRDIFLKSDL